VSRAVAEKLKGEHIISNLRHTGDDVELRIVSEKKPHDSAVSATPCLDDLYLYYFREESVNELNEV